MKLVGIMPVRNEAWCLGFTLRIALQWCDTVIVFAHCCTDASIGIAREIGWGTGRVIVATDDSERWDEMRHRQTLLDYARRTAATHIAIIDADEFMSANLLPSPDERSHGSPHILDYVNALPPAQILELPGYNMREMPGEPLTMRYHANGVWGSRWFATVFLDLPGLSWQGDRFHHREPFGCNWARWRPIRQGYGGTIHLWGASERRLRAKHVHYRLTERLRWPTKPVQDIERLYSLATSPREPWTFHTLPPTWIEPYSDWMQYLHIDEEPWQEADLRLLLETHGRDKFRGLDLLGY
jgi:Glycosyl transferase family 2